MSGSVDIDNLVETLRNLSTDDKKKLDGMISKKKPKQERKDNLETPDSNEEKKQRASKKTQKPTEKKKKKFGTRADVYNGLAEQTKGGLKKDDLIMKSDTKFISKKLSETSKSRFTKNK